MVITIRLTSLNTHIMLEQNRMPQITGSLISAVRDACRNGLLDWSPRLMLAMYTCDIQASGELICEPPYRYMSINV